MQIIHDTTILPIDVPTVVTVGSFDGVHRGHQALLAAARKEADRLCGATVVVSFEPHPRIALGRGEDFMLLTDMEEKASLLARYGVDYLLILRFNQPLAQMSGVDFATSVLIEKIGAKTLIAGYNHRFGHDHISAGDLHIDGLQIVHVDRCEVDGHRVSSSEIRRLIAAGNHTLAEQLLGHTINRLNR